MIFSRSTVSDSPASPQATQTTPATQAPAPSRAALRKVEDTAPPPRWGLLAAAVLAAAVTAAWVGSAFTSAQAVQAQPTPAQPQGK